MKGFLTLKNYTPKTIQSIIDTAINFKNNKVTAFHKKNVVALFFENSTRTHSSFIMAMLKLGITPMDVNVSTSSVNKGESLYDTVKTLEAIGYDGVVIRHPQNQYYSQLENVNIPIFNAGDGTSDHPTQTMLDLMTIYEEFGRFEGLKVCIVGDISHSRVAHGNAEIMKRLGMEVYIAGPDRFLDDTAPVISLDEAIKTCDVINLLRVQFERHENNENSSIANYHSEYGMTEERAKKMKEGAIIIHPAPVNRGIEIADSVVEAKNSRIFAQMTNGVFVRMAIMHMVFEGLL